MRLLRNNFPLGMDLHRGSQVGSIVFEMEFKKIFEILELIL